MNTKAKLWWIAQARLLTTSLAQAGGVRMYGQGEVPQASEVADILSGGSAQMHRPKMRSISLDPSFQAETKMTVAGGLSVSEVGNGGARTANGAVMALDLAKINT